MQPSLFDAGNPVQPGGPTEDEIVRAKQRHPGMLLLFRAGDGYELFDDDALSTSSLLGLELRPGARPLVRFPVESLEAQLRKLLHVGHRVAVCDRQEPY